MCQAKHSIRNNPRTPKAKEQPRRIKKHVQIMKCVFFKKKMTLYFHTPYLPHFLSILNNLSNYGCIKRILYNSSLNSRNKGTMQTTNMFKSQSVWKHPSSNHSPSRLLYPYFFLRFFLFVLSNLNNYGCAQWSST